MAVNILTEVQLASDVQSQRHTGYACFENIRALFWEFLVAVEDVLFEALLLRFLYLSKIQL